MNRIFRSIFLLLFLSGVIAAFYLESKLQLSMVGHGLVQVGILAGACWLAWRWVVYDEICNLRELHRSGPARYHYRIASSVQHAEALPNEPIAQLSDRMTRAPIPLAEPSSTKKTISIPKPTVRVGHVLMSISIVFVLSTVILLIGSKTLGEGVIAILYLAPIGWCTAHWGRLTGVITALASTLAFDYLFIPPYNTLNIGSPEGWLLLFLFMTIAVFIVGRIQSILTEEQERERKTTFLYEIVTAMANQTTREGIARTVANQIQQKFQAKDVQVHLDGGWGYQSFAIQVGNGQALKSSGRPDRKLTIGSNSILIGEIDIWQGTIPLPYEGDPMLKTMLSQIFAALDRIRVAEGKRPYPKPQSTYSEGNSFQTIHS